MSVLTNISGFPELLPEDQYIFTSAINTIATIFSSYGFMPLDTPAVEKVSTLLSKGNDNEIYGIYRLAAKDNEASKKDLALRFDLTVPLARYVCQHHGRLTFPFRRYHIAPVWRGERPQSGRYRQFYQCDIDIIADGKDSLSALFDSELIAVLQQVLSALNSPAYVVKVNNRKLLLGLIESFNIKDLDPVDIIRVIDKIDKLDAQKFILELESKGLLKDHIDIILELQALKTRNHTEVLKDLSRYASNEQYMLGLNELSDLIKNAELFDVDLTKVRIDPTLARGLNYYTGTIYEAILPDHPEIGSIAGGGRYANLAKDFSNKELPGVGLSIGISRLIPKLIALGALKEYSIQTVLVTTQNIELIDKYAHIANLLRTRKIEAELCLANKSLSWQLKYAAKKGIKYVIIADQNELEQNQVIVRNMQNKEQSLVAVTDIATFLKKADTSNSY